MAKKVLIAAGGTGGHVYPALGLAKQLTKINSETEILFVGGALNTNRYFDKNSFPYHSIDCGTFSRKSPVQCLQSLKNIYKGYKQSRKIFSDFKPDLVVGFGSYHTLPVLMAAKRTGIPIVLHEQNSVPGKVIRLFSRGALFTGVYFPVTAKHLYGRTEPMSMPLREGFYNKTINKLEARKHFKLDFESPVVLVFGGSQGARFINEVVAKALTQNFNGDKTRLQVLHFTGDATLASEIKASYDKASINSVVKEFEHRMDLAWKAADIMISRAGAGTIAEQIEFEVPGILIPYPFAADNHQESNADFLVKTVGGGLKFKEVDLNSSKLAHLIEKLLAKDDNTLYIMKEAIATYKRNGNTRDFGDIINQLLVSLEST